MGLPNTLKASPLQYTGGTVQAGAEFGNPLAQTPGAQASPTIGQATPFSPLPFSPQESQALTGRLFQQPAPRFPGLDFAGPGGLFPNGQFGGFNG